MEVQDPMAKKQRIEAEALLRWRRAAVLATEITHLLASDAPKAGLSVEPGANSTMFITWYAGTYGAEDWRLNRERRARELLTSQGWRMETRVL